MQELDESRTELVRLLQKQVDVLELGTFVHLTDAEWREYDKRQERIRELQARLDQSKDSGIALPKLTKSIAKTRLDVLLSKPKPCLL
jgi:hypothetical protein